jgi:preprotein translocase subunit SecA
VEWVLQALKVPDDQPIENKRVSSSIASAQAQVESQNFEIRKNILKYDDVMNRQRHAIYGDRRKVLEGADVEQQLRSTVDTVVRQYVRTATEGFAEDWDLEKLWTQMKTLYPVGLSLSDYAEREDLEREDLEEAFVADAEAAYDKREEQLGEEVMRELERRVLLTVLDRKWREHLYEMDYLREGIGLRAMAQRDPLVEYQREGGDMFNQMMEAFMEEVVGFVFHLDVQVTERPTGQVGVVTDGAGRPTKIAAPLVESGPDPDGPGVEVHTVGQPDLDEAETDEPEVEPEPETPFTRPKIAAKGLDVPGNGRRMSYSAPGEDGAVATTTAAKPKSEYDGVGRNAPCPCGSGKKFKMCHGRPGAS